MTRLIILFCFFLGQFNPIDIKAEYVCWGKDSLYKREKLTSIAIKQIQSLH